jgi:hypothetical protein
MNPRVEAVEPCEGYVLRIRFSSGETRLFDVSPYLSTGIFRELRETSLFRSVRPVLGSIQWSNGLDLCPDTLYEDSCPESTAASP